MTSNPPTGIKCNDKSITNDKITLLEERQVRSVFIDPQCLRVNVRILFFTSASPAHWLTLTLGG
jgi:hypothetical protein